MLGQYSMTTLCGSGAETHSIRGECNKGSGVSNFLVRFLGLYRKKIKYKLKSNYSPLLLGCEGAAVKGLQIQCGQSRRSRVMSTFQR